MFQLPVIDHSSRNRKRRKIRYQYINSLQRKYKQINNIKTSGVVSEREDTDGSVGLLTPENSENSEGEGTDSEKLKRRRRRLQSILGNAIDSSDDEDSQADDEIMEENDPESQFFQSYVKPETTFEVWNFDVTKRTPINRNKVTYNTVKKVEKSASRIVTRTLSYQTKRSNMFFQAIKCGYDVYNKPTLSKQRSMHLSHLNQLLYINVMNRNWSVAFRCFSILIRLEDIDIRSLWMVGSELLCSMDSNAGNESFLEWLSKVYSTRGQFHQRINFSFDPVFRSGSKTHSPAFVLTWLWTRLLHSSRTKNGSENEIHLLALLSKLEEMVLIPPYMDDSEVWYIYGIAHLVMANELAEKFRANRNSWVGSRADIARNQVIQHIHRTKNCLQTCRSNGFYRFPEAVIEQQLVHLERDLYSSNDEESDSGSEPNTSADQDGDIISQEEQDALLVPHSLDTQSYDFSNLDPEVSSGGFDDAGAITFGYESD